MKNAPDALDALDFIPLQPLELHMLLALIDTERHGYGILRDIEEQTKGQYRFPSATLYRYIDRMYGDEWIEWCRDRAIKEDDDHRRRYYRLTPLGVEILRAEMQRLSSIINSPRGKHVFVDQLSGTREKE